MSSRRLFHVVFCTALGLFAPFLAAAAPASPSLDVAGVRFPIPANWTPVDPEPATAVRVGQWALPQGAEAVAFYFGEGKGGDVKDNLASLAKRVTTPTGGPAPLDAEGTFRSAAGTTAGAFSFSWLVCYGVYMGDPLRSGIPALPKPDWGLVGYVAEFPGGPVYFRITGPAAAIRALVPQLRLGKTGSPLFPVAAPAAPSAAAPSAPAPAPGTSPGTKTK